jgi:P-type E1-E2 ATPase
MLTGDRRSVADSVAREIGVDEWRADCLPEQKLESVNALKAAGRRVMVVGDGVNDAPALAAGDLGVAMGAFGSDVAIQTADVALMNNDLRRLPCAARAGAPHRRDHQPKHALRFPLHPARGRAFEFRLGEPHRGRVHP